VHYPLLNAYESYGSFDALEAFASSILRNPHFADFVLRLDLQRQIETRLGPLEGDQVYIPAPYPFMGGDDTALPSITKATYGVPLDRPPGAQPKGLPFHCHYPASLDSAKPRKD
jgi:hypothetical protein